MSKSELLQLFDEFLDELYEEIVHGDYSEVDLSDFSTSSDPTLDRKITLLAEHYGFPPAFLKFAIPAFEVQYPEGSAAVEEALQNLKKRGH